MLADQERPSHVWEPQTTRLLKHLTASCQGDVLIGGAYFGDHAIVIGCQLRGSNRLVHCFEPNGPQADMLRKNGQLNDLDNLSIQELGLWHQSSQRLRLDGFDSFANSVPTESAEEGFETVTIDDYCAVQQRQLGVLMLDIEGAELSALRGAAYVIEQSRPSIVFEVHRDYVDWTVGLIQTPICRLLNAAGYTLFAVRDFNTHQEMGESCIELIPVNEVYLDGPPHGFNMLAITDIALVSGPLFRMVSQVSPKLLRHKAPDLHHPIDGLPL
jgi:FkbM family methyltransferase